MVLTWLPNGKIEKITVYLPFFLIYSSFSSRNQISLLTQSIWKAYYNDWKKVGCLYSLVSYSHFSTDRAKYQGKSAMFSICVFMRALYELWAERMRDANGGRHLKISYASAKVIPFLSSCNSVMCNFRNSQKFLQHLSTLTLKVILARKNAKDLQNGGRFPKLVLMQWVSFRISSVRGRFKIQQQQPCRRNRIKFRGRYLCFSFICMIRAFSLLLSYIEDKHGGC